jgi:capsular polysaccharide biosynthesis protein
MSQQQMTLRRTFGLVRRNKALAGSLIGLGLIIGAAVGSIEPASLTASALVIMPNTKVPAGTLIVIATSDAVLSSARPNITPAPASIVTLSQQVTATNSNTNIISVNAKAGSAALAENTANAVANSFVGYLASSQSPVGQVNLRVLQPASTASGPNPLVHRLVYGLAGAIAGLIIGLIVAIAKGRADRRLRSRDDIANAIGVPVLASLPVSRPANPQDWAKLLDSYEPSAVHGWRLRKTLQHLSISGVDLIGGQNGEAPPVVAVVSLAKDERALPLGPQLAVFAASLGIPTMLAIGPSPDTAGVTALKAVCARWSGQRGGLRASVADGTDLSAPRRSGSGSGSDSDSDSDSEVTVLVAVADRTGEKRHDTLQATATLLAVSAGTVTAEELAWMATSAAADGREVVGLLVANPDPSDRTTGRVPQLPRPAPRMPTRLTGTTTEVRP